MRLWRITTSRMAETALDIDCLARAPGRWNPKRVSVIYCSGSVSLALLEALWQNPYLAGSFAALPLELPKNARMERITEPDLPKEWRTAQGIAALRMIGARWAVEKRSLVLQVPSARLPQEAIYLINPLHPHFTDLHVGSPQTIDFSL